VGATEVDVDAEISDAEFKRFVLGMTRGLVLASGVDGIAGTGTTGSA